MTELKSRPTKSRRPKCPPGVVPRWRAKLGWGFRAKRMVEGETYWGKVRNSKEEALQDWINLGNRAAAVKQVEELLAAFDLVTSGLLPRTTADAKSKGRQWHVVRLALAVNFDGPL